MNGQLPGHLVRNISIGATLALIAAAVALYLSGNLFSPSPVVITLQIGAALLMLWARLTFGMRSFHAAANPTAGELITTGPYRYIRHPIYAAIWLFTWAGVGAHLTVATGALALLIIAALVARVLCEEVFLREHFPAYPDYATRTSRFIPFVL